MRITGNQGTGKSFFASQADLPQNIEYFDFEEKGKGIDTQLTFGAFHSVQAEASDGKVNVNPLNIYDYTMEKIAEIEPGTRSVVVLDNVSPFETAINAEAIRNVDRYCKAFNLNKKNVLAGRYGGANAVKNYWIAEFVAALKAKGVRLIIVISHTSNRWVSGVPVPNKRQIKGANKWDELSILSLILVPGTKPPVPDAQVWKEQLGSISIADDFSDEALDRMMRGETGHEMNRRLPYRIPQCTFQKLRYYIANPANLDEPEPGETIVEAELAPFREKLTNQQITFVHDAVKAEQIAEEQANKLVELMEKVATDPVAKKVHELNNAGQSIMEIAMSEGMSIPDVAAILKGIE
jgi:hypothetical protein